MNSSNFCRMFAVTLVMAGLSGCGGGGLKVPTGTVSGTVMVKGKPLDEGTITFIGESNGETATAFLEKGGTYSLKWGTGFSVPAGDYRVAVVAGAPANAAPADPASLMKTVIKPTSTKGAIPDKYKDPKTSKLIAVVKEGANTGVDFDLK